MILLAFILATITLFLQNILFAPVTLLSYIPFITLIVLTKTSPKTLYLAAISGSIVDLLSNDPMGVHTLSYCLLAHLMTRLKRYFSYDKIPHFALATWISSFLCTILQMLLLFIFDRKIPFSGQWTLIDLFFMPFLDAIYAIIWFSIPIMLYKKFKMSWRFFWKSKLSQN